jgi:hypothetical protein
MSRLAKMGLAVVAGLAMGSAAQAASSIGVNFSGGAADGGTPPAGPHVLLPTDVAGVVPQANWNDAPGATGASLPLIDSAGLPVIATLTYNANGTWGATPPTTTADDNLVANYLDIGTGNTGMVTITGVPYKSYDVYLYTRRNEAGFDGPLDAAHGGNNQTDGGSNYTVNGVFQHVVAGFNPDVPGQNGFVSSIGYKLDPAYTGSPTYLGDGGNYTVFHGVSGDLNVIVNDNNGTTDFRSPLDAVEIVDTSVPEPASLGFLSLGGLALLARRRRAV